MTAQQGTSVQKADGSRFLGKGETYATVVDHISDIVLTRPFSKRWAAALGFSSAFLCLLMISVTYLFAKGIGIWGNNIPVGWAWDIVNFVWWIGIGHAGTFISAILLLVRQPWRTSINRFAESMTLFAVACAGMYPLIHLGRPQFAFWLAPYPNTMNLWPQFRSPLVWDFFAVSTYVSVSCMFWFVGLVPDFAVLRDRAKNKIVRNIFAFAAMGWRGSARHWHRYESLYLLLAGLATPLVLSVHSIVSLDFAGGIVPGWHTTIFPPYFVAGAVFSGFAMVLTLAIPLRALFKLESYITDSHLENCAKLMITTGSIVAYGYFLEVFGAWYSGNPYELDMMHRRLGGYDIVSYAALIICNIIIPQFLWSKKIRNNLVLLFLISIVVNVGMWLERYVIIVASLRRDFMPSAWRDYHPTFWDISTFLGTLGLFFTLFFLFLRVLPVIAISEMQGMVDVTNHGHGKDHDEDDKK